MTEIAKASASSTSPPDAGARARALDPARSFIVQAPAGSGGRSAPGRPLTAPEAVQRASALASLLQSRPDRRPFARSSLISALAAAICYLHRAPLRRAGGGE